MAVIRKTAVVMAALLFACTLFGGCATLEKQGRGQYDLALLQAFNNFELNPAYEYYLHGAGNNYYALLGLKPGYTVPIHKMWKAMPVNDPEMRAISMFLWERPPSYTRMAFVLYDAHGNLIGEIFTSVTFSYLIEDDNTLTFYFQTPWLSDLYL